MSAHSLRLLQVTLLFFQSLLSLGWVLTTTDGCKGQAGISSCKENPEFLAPAALHPNPAPTEASCIAPFCFGRHAKRLAEYPKRQALALYAP